MNTNSVRKKRAAAERRRGVVAVQAAVMITVIVGFAALTIDVGAMYNAKADLQRTADAAALAAASQLTADGDIEELAKDTAGLYAAANNVVGDGVTLSPSDVTLHRAVSLGGAYLLRPNGVKNAVKVVVHYEMPLSFAGVFGKTSTNVTAEAVAMLVPRDIAVVADLSASHNDDSELRHFDDTDINLFDVWNAIPVPKGNNGVGNGIDPPPPGNPLNPNDPPGTGPGCPGNQGGNPDPGADPQGGQHGPTWGWMYYWGSELSQTYEPADDPGLIFLPKGADWVAPEGGELTRTEQVYSELASWYQAVGYSDAETALLTTNAGNDTSDRWANRVAVGLGLARWDSGLLDESGDPNGLWDSIPPGHREDGDGDNCIENDELTWLVDYPFEADDDEGSPGSWRDYIKNYAASSSTQMYYADSDFRYRFGIKTYLNYLLERKMRHSQTPDLAELPIQPMQAVKDAVGVLVETVYDLESQDQLSLEVYDTRGRHEVDLHEPGSNWSTDDVVVTLNGMQAGQEDVWTNMGAGILRAREELSSDRARPGARKVMILITDGYANVPSEYGSGGDYYGGKTYALAEAQFAADEEIQIFTVSVGSYADLNLMGTIAMTGEGEHLAASGSSIEEMSAQLSAVFQILGGKRQVELIR